LKRTTSQSWCNGLGIRKVLITDKVSKIMLDGLKNGGMDVTHQIPKSKTELLDLVKDAEVLLVRSGTQVTADVFAAAPKLKLVGRAGTGVDNIDIVAATKRGVMVMNTPGANTISAAEHTFALMVSVARNLQRASISFKVDHKWDRSNLMGFELQGKVLGILGLGRIGREVAVRSQAFGMKTIGYDPVLPAEIAKKAGIDAMNLEDVLAQADILTVHTPLMESTRNLIGTKTLPLCKKGVIVINCARGGIVDEEAICDAIDAGQVGGAGIDVFVEEPPKDIAGSRLINHPKVVATPHLGASTEEAQDKVADELVSQVLAVTKGKSYAGVLNAPALTCSLNSFAQPWLSLGYKIGSIIAQISSKNKETTLRSLDVETAGPELSPISDGFLAATTAGFLSEFTEDPINMVNSLPSAEAHGLAVSRKHLAKGEYYQNDVLVKLSSGESVTMFRGTVFHNEPRIVEINTYFVEVEPKGTIFLCINQDKPGAAAYIGGVFGDAGVNISFLSLGRKEGTGEALTVIGLDSVPGPEVISNLAKNENLHNVHLVHVRDP